MSEVPAGWYPSPEVPGQLQYWDGEAWTNYRAVASDDPAAQAQEQAAAAPQQAVTPQGDSGAGVATGTAGVAAAMAAGSQAGQARAGDASSQTIVPADQSPAEGKRRFGLPRRGGNDGVATAPSTQEDVDKALKRARLISFAGGIGLFILGFVIGKIV